MKKTLMLIGILSILGTNANACHGEAFGSGDYQYNHYTKTWNTKKWIN